MKVKCAICSNYIPEEELAFPTLETFERNGSEVILGVCLDCSEGFIIVEKKEGDK